MTSRRLISLAGIAVAGALTLSACGSDNTGSGTKSSASDSPAGGGGTTSAAPIACASGTLNGAGSTAQKNAMDEWTKQFIQQCKGANIQYNGNGSGSGRQAFYDKQVAFAGSDASIPAADQSKADGVCGTGHAINLPMVTGPIAVAYNLGNVKNLVLDAKTIAGIFSGKITKWDAPEIKALNPNAQLPSTAIQTVHRSDASGTTQNFTNYLKAAAGADWTHDAAQDWKAPNGQSAKGSDGVAAVVQQTNGAIGYMEESFAENSSLGMAQINTGASAPVALTPDAAGKAVADAQIVGTGNDLKLQLNYATHAEGAYPIILVTYEIACDTGNAQGTLPLLKSFLTYTSSDAGQGILAKNGYAPLPAAIATKVRSVVASLS